MRARMILALAMVPLMSSLSEAEDGFTQFMTGNRLSELCGAKNSVDEAVCVGFVEGVSDTLEAWRSQDPAIPGAKGCIPKGVTVGQLQKVVVKYLRQHPEELHYPGAALVITAINEAWCPGSHR